MALWQVESAEGGVVVDKYTNPPMNTSARRARRSWASSVRQWSDPAMRARP